MSQNSYFAYVSKLQINTYMNRQETVYSYFLISRIGFMVVLFDFVGKESVRLKFWTKYDLKNKYLKIIIWHDLQLKFSEQLHYFSQC